MKMRSMKRREKSKPEFNLMDEKDGVWGGLMSGVGMS